MRCKDAHKMMNGWIDGELSPDKRTTFDHHLSSCSACSAQAEELQCLTGLLGTRPPDLPSAGLKKKTLSLYLEEAGSPGVAYWWKGLGWGMQAGTMASLLIGLGIGCTLGYGETYMHQLLSQSTLSGFLFSAGDLLSSWV